MQFVEIINGILESESTEIGVLVPEHFQWSMLDLFKQSLETSGREPKYLVIPLYTESHDIANIIETHRKFFPVSTFIFLYDDQNTPEYDFGSEFDLYKE